ncbi:MAG: ATP-binding protein [Alcaligenes sp.]
MSTIRLKTNQHRLIANLRHAFNQVSMLGELLQNARRAKASHIQITVEGDTLVVSDDGTGIADLQTLIFIAESGWSEELQARENAFGLGVLSTLYFAQRLSVHSRDQAFNAATEAIICGEAVQVYSKVSRVGTEIRLEGVQSPYAGIELSEWVTRKLNRLCQAFPVPVSLNGTEIVRPLANTSLGWRQTAMGQVLIDLSASRTQWRCFLQGLPIGELSKHSKHQVILLPDDTLAKLPDRQYLLNETQDHKRIQAVVDQAYREALNEAKQSLEASEFVENYAQICLGSANADLLNDLPCVPRAWFRDWLSEPAGCRRYWTYSNTSGVITKETVIQCGAWEIASDEDDENAAEVYLEARQALLLENTGVDGGHWLKKMVTPISSAQIRVRSGVTLYRDESPDLFDDEVELELVQSLHLGLKAHPTYAVDAVRVANTLYLTPTARSGTELVSDYTIDDRYDEDREDEDARTIATFIAVGCSQSPDRVLDALLPEFLRDTAQPKLANTCMRLVFDSEGRLSAVEP